MKYCKVSPPLEAIIPDCWGRVLFDLTELSYSGPLALAHELAHAIELKITGRTTEYGAWQKAYSFIKPELWNYNQAQRCYYSYVRHGEHEEVLIYNSETGRSTRRRLRGKFPKKLDFGLSFSGLLPMIKINKRTQEVIDYDVR